MYQIPYSNWIAPPPANAGGGGTTYDNDISLGISMGLALSNNVSVLDSISIPITLSITASENATKEGLIDLNTALSLAVDSAGSDYNVGVTLPVTLTIANVAEAVAEGSLTLPITLDMTTLGGITIEEAISLGITLAVALANSVDAQESVSLGINLSVGAVPQATAEGSISANITLSITTAGQDEEAPTVQEVIQVAGMLIKPNTLISPYSFGSASSRVNLLESPSDFGSADWTQFNVSITPDTDGTADSMLETVDNGQHYVRQAITKDASAIRYTSSIEAESVSRSRIALIISNIDFSSYAYCSFDLVNGTSDGASIVGSFTTPSADIEDLGGGRYRVSLTATSDTSTDLVATYYIGTDAVTFSYAGDITKGLIIDNAFLEVT